MSTVWDVLLGVAAAVVLVGVGVEAWALRSRERGDTLSEHIRPWAKAHRGLFVALCGLLAAAGAWLPGHILGG